MNRKKRDRSARKGRDNLRRIVRYPNRRLYDFDVSQYISFAVIHRLVRRGIPFQIKDYTTGADMTCAVLLQVLLEQEQAGKLRLPEKLIRNLIRRGGG